MSNEHEIPIGTNLWYRGSEEYDWIVIGHTKDGDLLVNDKYNRYPYGLRFCGQRTTKERLAFLGWTFVLPGPKISNKQPKVGYLQDQRKVLVDLLSLYVKLRK